MKTIRRFFAWLFQPCVPITTQFTEADKLIIQQIAQQMLEEAERIKEGNYLTGSNLPPPTIPERRTKPRS